MELESPAREEKGQKATLSEGGRQIPLPSYSFRFPSPQPGSLKPQRTSTPPPDSKMVLSEARRYLLRCRALLSETLGDDYR